MLELYSLMNFRIIFLEEARLGDIKAHMTADVDEVKHAGQTDWLKQMQWKQYLRFSFLGTVLAILKREKQ